MADVLVLEPSPSGYLDGQTFITNPNEAGALHSHDNQAHHAPPSRTASDSPCSRTVIRQDIFLAPCVPTWPRRCDWSVPDSGDRESDATRGQANGCQQNEFERGDCRNFTIAGRRGQSLCHRSRRSDLCHRAPIRRFETGPFGRFGGMARAAVVDQIAHRRAAIWRPYPLSRQRRDPE